MKRFIKNFLLKIKLIKYYAKGKNFFNNINFIETNNKNLIEVSKRPLRSEIINYLLSLDQNQKKYLEIGVRNPAHNFNLINAEVKYSVDPGLEFETNPVDFKMTSDIFFEKLSTNEILQNNIRFDVIFIDGLHLAEQVERDISNSLKFIKDDGFIVLHDCNPPSEWHAREKQRYWNTPALDNWNGTTWKAFLKYRSNSLLFSCCIDTDWGVGIISKKRRIGNPTLVKNPFFEFHILEKNRKESLNLMKFEIFKEIIENL